jgi:hypothetical protein
MNVEKIASRAAENVEHIAARAASATHLNDLLDKGAKGAQTAAKAVATYASLKTLMRAANSLSPAHAVMSALGIQRRASLPARIATTAGLIAAGAAVGAGVALLLTPMSGADLRAAMMKRIRGAAPGARREEEPQVARDEEEPQAEGLTDGAARSAAGASGAEAPKRQRAQSAAHRNPVR